jgi:hypothetical protein
VIRLFSGKPLPLNQVIYGSRKTMGIELLREMKDKAVVSRDLSVTEMSYEYALPIHGLYLELPSRHYLLIKPIRVSFTHIIYPPNVNTRGNEWNPAVSPRYSK